MKSKIAIFASGRGSNSRAIIDYFDAHQSIQVDCILCNRRKAGVFEVARTANIPAFHYDTAQFRSGEEVLKRLEERGIDWIVLAGFLLKVPALIIGAYRGRMVNIHPSLLPKFGGDGMYGDHVHRAVLEGNESKSGISIHMVDENYDTGALISQHECSIHKDDDLQTLKLKIQELEHRHLPPQLEKLILKGKA